MRRKEGGSEGGKEDKYLEASVGRVFDGLVDVANGPGDEPAFVERITTRHGEGLARAGLPVWGEGGREVGREGGRISGWREGMEGWRDGGREGGRRYVQAKTVPL